MKSEYAAKLRDPRWQKKRLEILQRDEWTCQACFDNESTLAVHHRIYLPGKDPWEYPDDLLVTLCETCHSLEIEDRPQIESLMIQRLKQLFLYGELCALESIFSLPNVLNDLLKNKEVEKQLLARQDNPLNKKS